MVAKGHFVVLYRTQYISCQLYNQSHRQTHKYSHTHTHRHTTHIHAVKERKEKMELSELLSSLDLLASNGVVLSTHMRAVLQTSLVLLKNAEKFESMRFFGKLSGSRQDYYIAQGLGANHLLDKKSFFRCVCVGRFFFFLWRRSALVFLLGYLCVWMCVSVSVSVWMCVCVWMCVYVCLLCMNSD